MFNIDWPRWEHQAPVAAEPQSMPKRKRLSGSENEQVAAAAEPASNSNQGVSTMVEPRQNDVLFGRGDSINRHPGNKKFRELVDLHKRVYLASRFKQEKRMIADGIIATITELDPPGRFLAKGSSTGVWQVVDSSRSREKTLQALREKARTSRDQVDDRHMIIRQTSSVEAHEAAEDTNNREQPPAAQPNARHPTPPLQAPYAAARHSHSHASYAQDQFYNAESLHPRKPAPMDPPQGQVPTAIAPQGTLPPAPSAMRSRGASSGYAPLAAPPSLPGNLMTRRSDTPPVQDIPTPPRSSYHSQDNFNAYQGHHYVQHQHHVDVGVSAASSAGESMMTPRPAVDQNQPTASPVSAETFEALQRIAFPESPAPGAILGGLPHSLSPRRLPPASSNTPQQGQQQQQQRQPHPSEMTTQMLPYNFDRRAAASLSQAANSFGINELDTPQPMVLQPREVQPSYASVSAQQQQHHHQQAGMGGPPPEFLPDQQQYLYQMDSNLQQHQHHHHAINMGHHEQRQHMPASFSPLGLLRTSVESKEEPWTVPASTNRLGHSINPADSFENAVNSPVLRQMMNANEPLEGGNYYSDGTSPNRSIPLPNAMLSPRPSRRSSYNEAKVSDEGGRRIRRYPPQA